MKKIYKWMLAVVMIFTISCIGMSIQKEEIVAADNWYEDYEYNLTPSFEEGERYITLNEYKGKAVKSIYVPAKVTIDGVTYTTRLNGMSKSVWYSAREKLTTIKFQKGCVLWSGWSFCEGLYKLKSINVEALDISEVQSMNAMFSGCSNLKKLNTKKWDTGNVEYMNNVFEGCKKLSSLDVSKWNTSKVKSMSGMFRGCEKLSKIDVGKWKMSKVESTAWMFANCSSLKSLNVEKWDTSNITNMFNMFGGCEKLSSLDVSKWNTSKVTIMTSVFDHCKSLSKINVSNWNVSKVTNTDFMFYKCEVLKSLDLHKWKTSKLTSMYEMFGRCYNLTSVNLKGWNTSKVTTMAGLFSNNYNLTSVDLSSFNMKNVTDTTNMFVRTASLKTIKTPKNVKEDITISSSLSYVKKTGSKLGTKVYNCIPKGKKSITLVCTTGKSKSTKITSISSSKKKIKLTWNNMAAQDVWGRVQYEVQCSTNKNFTDLVGTMTNVLDEGYTYSVHRNITEQPNTTIKGLEKGKTYYVRVRVQVYGQRLSSWSAVKKIKVK